MILRSLMSVNFRLRIDQTEKKKIVSYRSVTFFILTMTLLFSGGVRAADQGQKAEEAREKAAVLEDKAAAQGRQARPSPSETITKTEAQAVDLTGKEPLNDAITCLARTIYWEARNEDDASMQAIANVVMNRLVDGRFPKTICSVVKQGREKRACQFSWWCDGLPDQAQKEEEYTRAKEIARKVLNRELGDLTKGALYFHNRDVAPSWAKGYIRTAEIGKHLFYKPRGGKTK